MVTAVSKEFDDVYKWRVETFRIRHGNDEDEEKFLKRKKELKDDGFIVRTHWYSSLGAYGLRAIKKREGNSKNKEMLDFVKF
jgi:hypothetical protein